jgi:hypothetical protein
MIARQLEHDDAESKYFLIRFFTFFHNLTIADNVFNPPKPLHHYPDVHPAPETVTKQKETVEKEIPESKRKEPPTTTSAETTIVTKRIKVEGSGSRGRIRTADFGVLKQSLVEETISIYRAQIGGVDPFPERSDDRDTVKQAWLEVCTARNVEIDIEDDMYKVVCDTSYFQVLHFVEMICLCRLSDVLHKHEAMPKLRQNHILYLHTSSMTVDRSARFVTM